MAQIVVNFRMDEDLKKGMKTACRVDPFYSEANMSHLRKVIADVHSGKATLTEHELIEVDDD